MNTVQSPARPAPSARAVIPMSGIFNGTVFSITLRAALGRRRAFLLAIPPVILLLVTFALKAGRPAGAPWPGRVLGDFGFSVILPLTASGTVVLSAIFYDQTMQSVLDGTKVKTALGPSSGAWTLFSISMAGGSAPSTQSFTRTRGRPSASADRSPARRKRRRRG